MGYVKIKVLKFPHQDMTGHEYTVEKVYLFEESLNCRYER